MAYGCKSDMVVLPVQAVNTHREKPSVSLIRPFVKRASPKLNDKLNASSNLRGRTDSIIIGFIKY